MNKDTIEQIEKDAKEYYETFAYTTAAHKAGYVAGATAQHPKAWNAALDKAIEACNNHAHITEWQQLKTKIESLKI